MTDLTPFRRQHVRLTDNAPPVLLAVVAKGADGFGVAVLHGGEAVAFLTPKQAESEGRRLIELAKLARNPGKCPGDIA